MILMCLIEFDALTKLNLLPIYIYRALSDYVLIRVFDKR